MSLPLVRAYPITFSISLDLINQQYRQLADAGQLPTYWQTQGDSWQLTASLGHPYIDIDPNVPQSIRLNFPVQQGTFHAIVGRGNGYEWVPYQLDGIIFKFLTPTRLIHTDDPANRALTVQALFLDLDSPYVDTIVETSQAINTRMPDHIRVSLANRIRAYVQELAQQDPRPFIISTTVVSKAIQADHNNWLEPNGANFSTYPQGKEAINWLFELPAIKAPDSPGAGKFDSDPLLNNSDVTMRVAGDLLIGTVILPAVSEQTGVAIHHFDPILLNSLRPPLEIAQPLNLGPAIINPMMVQSLDNFWGNIRDEMRRMMKERLKEMQRELERRFSGAGSTSPSVSLKHPCHMRDGWVLLLADMFPAGDHIQCNFAMTKTESHSSGWWVFKASATITVTTSWETHISFYHKGGDEIGVNAVNQNHQTDRHASGSIMGIPIPSFIMNLALKLAEKLAGSLGNPSVHIERPLSRLMSRIKILGGGSFNLSDVTTQNGNLVMGLRANLPSNGGQHWSQPKAQGLPYVRLPANYKEQIRSTKGDESTEVTFTNRTGNTLTLHWIDYSGKMPSRWGQDQKPYVIKNEDSLTLTSYVTHPFAVYNQQDQCVCVYLLDAQGNDKKMHIYIYDDTEGPALPYARLPASYVNVVKSQNSNQALSATIHNALNEDISLRWINYEGQVADANHATYIARGGTANIGTYVTHPFAVYNSQNECLCVYDFLGTATDGKVDVYIHG